MGNAVSSIVRDSDALQFNPAGLANISGVHWTIADPYLGASGIDVIPLLTSSNGNTANTLNQLYGKTVWSAVGAKTAFTMGNFGFSAFGSGSASFNLQNPAYPQMTLNYLYDYGFNFGFAMDIIPSMFKAGVTLKRVTRAGSTATLGPAILAQLSNTAIIDSLSNTGLGYGLDLGMILTLPSPIKPSFSVVWRDVGNTSFVKTSGNSAPPAMEQNVVIGSSLQFSMPLVTVSPTFDYHYANISGIELGRKTHFGIELDLPVIDIRAGLNQGYWTAGFGFDMGFMRIDAATYGTELGEYLGQLEDRRYIIQASIELGLDLGLKFGSSSDSANAAARKDGAAGRRKLKQRR
jgi:hypothetical protein